MIARRDIFDIIVNFIIYKAL